MRIPVAGVPLEAFAPSVPQIPTPFADVPRALPGGKGFLTEILTPSKESLERFFTLPLIPGRIRGGENFLTEFHDVPAPPPADLVFSVSLPPLRRERPPLIDGPKNISFTVRPPIAMDQRGWYQILGRYQEAAAHNQPFSVAYIAGATTIQNATPTVVRLNSPWTFDTGTDVDRWGMLDLGLGTLVSRRTGVYQIGCYLSWGVAATGYRQCTIDIYNGAVFYDSVGSDVRAPVGGIGLTATHVGFLHSWPAGHHLRITVVQTSGGPLSLNVIAWAKYIGPT